MTMALALEMTPLPAYANAVSVGNATGSGLTAAPLGAQAARNYAVFDSDTGTLTFKYGACAHANGQTDGTSTYYTTFDADRYVYALDVPWYGKRSSIKKVVFDDSARGHLKPTSTAYWFCECKNLASVEGEDNLETSSTKNMASMFYNCSSLSSLDASEWKTASVTNMGGMFQGCLMLESLDLSGWDVSRVPRMSEMFSGCSSLASLDLSGWDTSKVTGLGYLFFGCESLASVTLGDKFSFEGDGMTRCELPTPPDEGYTGKWVNVSTSGASPITAADLRDNYPNADDTSYAPGTYVWAPVLGPIESVDDSGCVYDGADQVPTVVLRSPNGEALVEGADYRLKLSDNVNAGEGWLQVVGLGLYAEQTIECAFTVHPRVAEFAWSGATSSAYDGTQKKRVSGAFQRGDGR